MATIEYKCKICNNQYKTYQTLWKHNIKFHNSQLTEKHVVANNPIIVTEKSLTCKYCNKVFKHKQNKYEHQKKACKFKEQYNGTIKLELLKEENKKLELEIKLKTNNNEIDDNSIVEQPINNQLINIIVDKNKTIEELKTKINNNNESNTDNKILGKPIIEFHKLILNDVIIVSRTEDNYINATQLCQASNKQFNDWFRLNTTKQLISVLEAETGTVSQLVDVKIGVDHSGTWIHPDLAIQLAQWISPIFLLQVSKWIRTLLTDGHVELLKNKDDELKLKSQKIQLLEDTYIKQQKRKNYPTKNVIYMLTTEDQKKNRLYIIGKASNLKKRLSNYNKTAEHEVIYYKNCESEKDMTAIETLVLKKLNKYREKANRDRFILPLENDISLFTNVINDCINFLIE
jgi:hypothetical protein